MKIKLSYPKNGCENFNYIIKSESFENKMARNFMELFQGEIAGSLES